MDIKTAQVHAFQVFRNAPAYKESDIAHLKAKDGDVARETVKTKLFQLAARSTKVDAQELAVLVEVYMYNVLTNNSVH